MASNPPSIFESDSDVDCSFLILSLQTCIRNKIQHYFTTSSPLKIVIATIAFGLGMNCPNIRQIIHLVCQKAVKRVQEHGQACRGASALMLRTYARSYKNKI